MGVTDDATCASVRASAVGSLASTLAFVPFDIRSGALAQVSVHEYE
jgi:hypothetical protein